LPDNLTTSTTVSTIPAATVIATDQLATGEHVQYGKLMDGTLDGTTKVVATTSAPSASAGALVTRPLLYDANGVAIVQKAASTAPGSTDPALVVALSPNSANSADTTTSGVFSSGASTLVAQLAGAANAALYMDGSSTFIGTVNVAGSVDGGVSFTTTLFVGLGAAGSAPISLGGASAQTLIHIPAGVNAVKVTVQTYTSGTGTLSIRATNSGNPISALLSTSFPASASSPQINVRATIAGTGGGTPAVANGTNPTFTDKALVVTNSPLSHPPFEWTDNAILAALNATIGSYDYGRGGASITIPTTSTLVGTLTPQVNMNGDGTTWTPTWFIDPNTGQVTRTLTTVSGTAYSRSIFVPPGHYATRVIVTSYTSGTTGSIFMNHAALAADVPLFSQAAGSPIVANQPVALIGVNDGSGNASALTMKALPTGGSGLAAVPVYTNAIQAPTYTSAARAVATGILTANTAKQIISFEKTNAAKTVKIRRIIVSGYQTTATALAGTLEFQLNRGSAASSGGTAATVNGGPRVGSDAADVICTLKSLPTIVAATLVDTIPGFVTPTAAATGFPFTPIFDWQEAGETKPWTLVSGAIDSLVLSVISTAAQSWTLSFHIVYTVE
jgi:hypothetical protein